MPFPIPALFHASNRPQSPGWPTMAGWTQMFGSGLQVISNAAGQLGTGETAAYWSTPMSGPDVEIGYSIGQAPVAGGKSKLFARLDPAGGGDIGSGYCLEAVVPNTLTLVRYDASTRVVIAGPWVAGSSVIYLRCIGSVIEAWYIVTGVLILAGSAVDTTYPGTGANNKIGLGTDGNGSSQARYDHVYGGVIVGSGIVGISNTDTGSGTDAGIPIFSGADTGAGTDTATPIYFNADSGTGTDASTVTTATLISGTDSGSGSEASTLASAYTATDTGSDTEAQIISIIVSDSGGDAEAVPTFFHELADSGTGTENSIVSLVSSDANGTTTESGIISVPVSVTDSGSGVEASAIGISQTETGTATETTLLTVPYTVTDSGTDSETHALVITATETGSGTESQNVSPTVTGETGSDSEASIISFILSDTGSTSDTGNQTVPISITDSGAGTDTSIFAAAYVPSEFGIGTEAFTASAIITDTDTGTDVEVSPIALVAQADTGSGSEDSTVSASLGDAGSGSEGSDFNREIVDSGTDVESSLVGLLDSDSGTGAESFGARAFAMQDSGQGIEDIEVNYHVADIGSGVDSEIIETESAKTGIDFGVGSETSPLAALYSTQDDAGTGNEDEAIAILVAELVAAIDSSNYGINQTLSDFGTSFEFGSLGKDVLTQEFGIGQDNGGIFAETGFHKSELVSANGGTSKLTRSTRKPILIRR